MPVTARGLGWRSRAGWWRRTQAASRWKTARRAKRGFALPCRRRTRSRCCDWRRFVLSEDVNVDILEPADQGGGGVPGPPPAPPVTEDDFGIQSLAEIAGESRRNVAS